MIWMIFGFISVACWMITVLFMVYQLLALRYDYYHDDKEK